MHGFPYSAVLISAAIPALLLAPIRLRAQAQQRGFSARLTLGIRLFFGLIRIPLRFLLEFDAEKAMREPFELKDAFSFFKLTRFGRRKPLKAKRTDGARAEKLPFSPILSAFSLKKLVLNGRIALGDAAACVLLCGTLNALAEPLFTLAASLSPIRARNAGIKALFLPEFTENSARVKLEGIVESNAAKLIKGFISAFAAKRAAMRRKSGQSGSADLKKAK